MCFWSTQLVVIAGPCVLPVVAIVYFRETKTWSFLFPFHIIYIYYPFSNIKNAIEKFEMEFFRLIVFFPPR